MGLCLPLAVMLGYFWPSAGLRQLGGTRVRFWSFWRSIDDEMASSIADSELECLCQSLLSPGSPGLWMIMTFASLVFALLGRSVNPEIAHFCSCPGQAVALPAGRRPCDSLYDRRLRLPGHGAERYGGKGYFYIFAAVAAFFAFTAAAFPRSAPAFYVRCSSWAA